MSYILDALKKSEQERHREQIPDLGGSDALLYIKKQHRPVALYLVIALLLLVIIGMAIFQWSVINQTAVSAPIEFKQPPNVATVVTTNQRNQVDDVSKSTASAQTVIPPIPEGNPVKSDPISRQATEVLPDKQEKVVVDLQVDSELDEPIITPPEVEQATIIRPSVPSDETLPASDERDAIVVNVPYLEEMDLDFRRSIPGLSFNSHIYSDNPSARRVMINSIYLREGQDFMGMRLDAIQEQSIILEKNGTRFKLGVLRDWVRPN